MSTSKHTPTPWSFRSGWVVGPQNERVCEFFSHPSFDDQQFVTTAVNCHDDMLEALRHAEAVLSYAPEMSTNKNGGGPNTSTHHALRLVRAAIAKAEGRS